MKQLQTSGKSEKIFINILLIILFVIASFFCITFPSDASSVYSIKSQRVKTTLYTGVKKKFQIKKYAKKKKLKWVSSKKKVATIDKYGNVKTKNPGKTIIRCKVGKKTYKCTLTVKKRKMSSLKFSYKSLQLYVGQSKKVSPNISPATTYDKRIRYTSSNPNVASVDRNGIIRAVSMGTTKITATAMDGSGKKSSFTLSVLEKLKKDSVKFVAHRGLSSQAPENTAKSFELAGKAGFWGAETDVRVTKDGQFILLHDDTFQRMCGDQRKPEDMTLAEIKELKIISGNNINQYGQDESAIRICTLVEYLEICKEYKMVPVIEIKISKESYDEENGTIFQELEDTPMTSWHELMQNVDDTVESVMGNNQYLVISFKKDVLSEMSLIRSEREKENMKLQLLFNSSVDRGSEIESNLSFASKYHTSWNIKDYSNSAQSLIQKAKNAGMEINVWTVDSVRRAEILNFYHVDYITTNVILWNQ